MSTSARVEIYSSPTCPDCKAGKEFLAEHHIDYIDHDVSHQSEADALQELTGKSIVPTFLKILYGFAASRENIESLLLGDNS